MNRLPSVKTLATIFGQNDGEWLTYLNAGDTYAPTLCYWRGRYYVASLGAMVESLEKKRIFFN